VKFKKEREEGRGRGRVRRRKSTLMPYSASMPSRGGEKRKGKGVLHGVYGGSPGEKGTILGCFNPAETKKKKEGGACDFLSVLRGGEEDRYYGNSAIIIGHDLALRREGGGMLVLLNASVFLSVRGEGGRAIDSFRECGSLFLSLFPGEGETGGHSATSGEAVPAPLKEEGRKRKKRREHLSIALP